MGTKYMLLGIVLCLCGILLTIPTSSSLAYIFAGGGLLLAIIGLFKEG